MTVLSFGEGNRRHFEVVPALSEESRQESYRLRHEVYCRERGWESVRYDGLESDRFDAQALHCLIRSVSTGRYLGCARIVLPHADDPNRPLPFEMACEGALDHSIIDSRLCDRSKIGEISRFTILDRLRCRTSDSGKPVTLDCADGSRQRLPYLPLGLYLGLIAMAEQQGLETLFVLTEPRLIACLSRLGVDVVQVGDAVEHRGTRIPYVMHVNEVLGAMNGFVRPFYDAIAGEVAARIAVAKRGPAAGVRASQALLCA